MPAIRIGYARVSTTDQDTDTQIKQLLAAKCEREDIFHEQLSGTKVLEDRPQLEAALAHARPGDTLVVTRIDRLARDARALHNLLFDLDEDGINLEATEQAIDTSTPMGKMFISLLGIFAEFETNLRAERQKEGVQKAKDAGVYKGKPPKLKERYLEKARELWANGDGMTRSEIGRELGIARASVYKLLPIDKAA